MIPAEYSYWVNKMDLYPQNESTLSYYGLGLSGEVGEVNEKIKRLFRDGTKTEAADMGRELGDVLWYLTAIGNRFGLNLQQIIDLNVEKLEDRKRRNVQRGSGDNR